MANWFYSQMSKEEKHAAAVDFARKRYQESGKSQRAFFKIMRLSESVRRRFSPVEPPEWTKIQGCVNSWQVSRNYGESGTNVYVFPYTGGKKQLRKIRKALSEAGINLEGVDINSPYDCTGQYFSRSAEMHVCKGRVFVTQWWGMDV